MNDVVKVPKIYETYIIYYIFSNKLNQHSIVASCLSLERVKSNLMSLKNDITTGLVLQQDDWDYCILDTLKDVSKQYINERKTYWTNNCVNYFKTRRAVGLKSINERKKQIVINRRNGLKLQSKVMKVAEKVFYTDDNVADKSIVKSLFEFSSWDWFQSGYFFECKSSRFHSTSFPCAILSVCKYDYYDNIAIIFHFTDGLFFIKYDAELFATFERKYHKSNLCNQQTWCVFIPITNLVKFDKKSKILLEPINETDAIREKREKLLEKDLLLGSIKKT